MVISLKQEGPGVHLNVGLTGDIKFVCECERNFGFAHQLFVGVVRWKRILTWTRRRTDQKEEKLFWFPLIFVLISSIASCMNPQVPIES